MVLAHLTWPEVEALSREVVVLIPTGSLEQHGPHLPLFTDSILATTVAEAIEKAITEKVLLTPTLWLGASTHHLAFAGTLSASTEGYIAAVEAVVQSLLPHGFHKFFLINGHGGNNEPNGIALRELKARHPEATFGHSGYYAYAETEVASVLEGPLKSIRHACEAETSMMMHVRPDLVRLDKRVDDGLTTEPSIRGLVHHFDEQTRQGSYGYATLATAEKGRTILEAAIRHATKEIEQLADGYVLVGIPPHGA